MPDERSPHKRLRDLWESMVLTSTLGLSDRDRSRHEFDKAMADLVQLERTLKTVLLYLQRSQFLVGADALREDVEAALSNPASSRRQSPACKHPDVSFDRSLCACGAMHYYCTECGAQTDECSPDDQAVAYFEALHELDAERVEQNPAKRPT